MAAAAEQQGYRVFHRDLTGAEQRGIGGGVRAIRSSGDGREYRGRYGRVMFVQEGKLPLGFCYAAYPVAFPFGMDGMSMREILASHGISAPENYHAFKYFIVAGIGVKGGKRAMAGVATNGRMESHEGTFGEVKGTETERRMAEFIHSSVADLFEIEVRKGVLHPRLLRVLTDYNKGRG